MNTNQRLFPRFNFEGPLKFQVRGAGATYNTVGDDLSQSGIGFVHHEFIPASTALNLEIKLIDRVVKTIGKVMWARPLSRSNKFRVGVNFIEFDILEKKFLEDFISLKKHQLEGV